MTSEEDERGEALSLNPKSWGFNGPALVPPSSPQIAQARVLFLEEGKDGDISPTSLQAVDLSAEASVSSDSTKNDFLFRLKDRTFLDSFAELRNLVNNKDTSTLTGASANIKKVTAPRATTTSHMPVTRVNESGDSKTTKSQVQSTEPAIISTTEAITSESRNNSHISTRTPSPHNETNILLEDKLLLSKMISKKTGYAHQDLHDTNGDYYSPAESQVTYLGTLFVPYIKCHSSILRR